MSGPESAFGIEVRGWISLGGLPQPVEVHLTAAAPFLEGRLIADHGFARGMVVPLLLADGGRALLVMAGDRRNRFVGLGRLDGPGPTAPTGIE